MNAWRCALIHRRHAPIDRRYMYVRTCDRFTTVLAAAQRTGCDMVAKIKSFSSQVARAVSRARAKVSAARKPQQATVHQKNDSDAEAKSIEHDYIQYTTTQVWLTAF